MRRIEQRIEVRYQYPVEFTEGVFSSGNQILRDVIGSGRSGRLHRVMAFVDENVVGARPGLIQQIKNYFKNVDNMVALVGEPRVVAGGEVIKAEFASVEEIIQEMLGSHLDRHAYVLAIGGGAVLDAVGLAASLVHRGLRIIRLPTTVLAQNDAGVGVKTGIDIGGAKNAIGNFCPPYAVINDFEFLATLPDREWIAGVSEAFKVAIIRNVEFFDWLCSSAVRLRRRDLAEMKNLVFRCAVEHLDHMRIAGDPFEFGSARPLDFGHWSAHKLERMSGYRIAHGEAVAIGTLLDSRYAMAQGLLSESEFERIRNGLDQSGLPLWTEELDVRMDDGQREVFKGLAEFQEHLGGELCITMPYGLGARIEVSKIDLALMDAAINSLRP